MDTTFEAIVSLLSEQNVAYRLILHENMPERQVMNANGLALHQGAKSLVLTTDKGPLLIVLAGDRRLDLKKLQSICQLKQVRLATNGEIKSLMGCEIGSCYPIGNVIGLQTIVDASFMDNETIFFNPGVPDKWITMSLKDFMRIVNPMIISTAQPQ